MWNNTGNIEIGTDGTNTNGEVNLKTKGVQALTVQSDGRVRAGTLPTVQGLPGSGQLPKLSVHGTFGLRTTFSDQIAEWAIDPYVNLNFYYNGGNKAHISGSDGSWNQVSDSRLKENFEIYKPVLEGIKKLNVMTYHYRADKTSKRCFGLIAQNVQRYFPEIISTFDTKENLLGLDYSKTGVLAIKAIREQQEIIEAQQRKIDALEERLAALENKLK